MPFAFTGFKGKAYDAKAGVVRDGDTFTVSATDGYTLTSTISSYTIFVGNPTRTGTGAWKITLKDNPIVELLDFNVSTLVTSGSYVGVQKLLPTTDSNGRTVLSWVFNTSGTPVDLPTGGLAQKFIVHVVYTESSLK